MTELILIRHGESEGNVGCSTDPDCGLTERGLQQARELGRRLRESVDGFVAVCSPYRRAQQTAGAIAGETSLEFTSDDLVREWGPPAQVGDRHYPGEQAAEVVARLEAFLARYRGQRVVVVSHAAPIAILTQLAWQETPLTTGDFWKGVANCCPRWVKSLR